MMKAVDRIGKFLIRLLILWIVDALSLAAAAWVLPGMSLQAAAGVPRWLMVIAAAGLLAIVNLVLRPIVLRLAMPLGWVATLAIGFLATAMALWITAWILPGFDVGIVAGLIGGIVIAFFNTILIDILDVNVENSWYQSRSESLAKKTPFAAANEPGHGLMMVEVDGLSYWHIKQAIADGLMPAMQEMVEALIQHEGIGLVVGYADDGTAVAMGKQGQRNLHTGVVEGGDPLLVYAPPSGHGAASVATRAWQLQRVMDFPSAGDLWVISTLYPDGTVAALEELVGNHGGVGGEQTDAFLFHPTDLVVPETRNAIDVFQILNGYRPPSLSSQGSVTAPGSEDR